MRIDGRLAAPAAGDRLMLDVQRRAAALVRRRRPASAARDRDAGAQAGRWPYPLWIAHRGAGKLAPENTLAAFRLGASTATACSNATSS